MGISINRASITAKVNAAIGSASFQAKGIKGMDKAKALAIANQAGQDLAQAIQSAASASLSGGELAAVGDISSGGATEIGDGVYQIGINISQQSRPSLWQGAAYDMAALFNIGWGGGGTYGMWHGERIRGRRFRPGSYFVQNGVEAFGSGNGDYKVLSIRISGRFVG